MEVSFLEDSFAPSDTVSEPVNQLNFPDFTASTKSSTSSSSSSKKRKRCNLLVSCNDLLPSNKKHRPLPNIPPQTTALTGLNGIDEHSTIATESSTNTVHKRQQNEKHKVLRRSARIRNKQNETPMCSVAKINLESLPNINVDIESLSSLSLSPLRGFTSIPKAQRANVISECVKAKWNAAATPIRSSMKKHKTKKKITSDAIHRRVNWGHIECRNYEQRCGILSSAVPSESGPSLHLGRLLSETTTNIDDYESTKQGMSGHGTQWGELPKKERIQRVKQFSTEDVERRRLKEDMEEIKLLNESRIDIGCKCVSIYKMKKNQMISRILYLDTTLQSKQLKKQKKEDLFKKLIGIQFEKYGRYDVCCVDEDCVCVREGIECQIDSECCTCGGDVVYNNYLNGIEKEKDKQRKKKKKKMNKKNSLCCANPNGNTLNVSVLDYVDNEHWNELYQHDIAKSVESPFLSFKSPVVQTRINEWKEHYNNCNDQDEACVVARVLNFQRATDL